MRLKSSCAFCRVSLAWFKASFAWARSSPRAPFVSRSSWAFARSTPLRAWPSWSSRVAWSITARMSPSFTNVPSLASRWRISPDDLEETWTLVASMVPEASIAREPREHAARLRHTPQGTPWLSTGPASYLSLLGEKLAPRAVREDPSEENPHERVKELCRRDGELEHLLRRDDRADGVDEEHGRQVGVYVCSG